MKKLLILVSVLCSLHGAEQNMRAPNLLTSMQGRWPYVAAACGVAAVCIACKSIMQYREDVTNARKLREVTRKNQQNAELVEAMAPYLHAWARIHKFALAFSYIVEMAASDSDVIKLLPEESKTYPIEGPSGAYDMSCEKYLNQKVFTRKNMEAVKYEEKDVANLDGLISGYIQPIDKYNFKLDSVEQGEWNCYGVARDEKEEREFSPEIFFKSSVFLGGSNPNHTAIVDLKRLIKTPVGTQAEAVGPSKDYIVRLKFTKEKGFVTSAEISDRRGQNIKVECTTTGKNGKHEKCEEGRYKIVGIEQNYELTPFALMDINREYIKRLFVMCGGTLYKPQQKTLLQEEIAAVQTLQQAKYAWYNPVRWLHRWFGS